MNIIIGVILLGGILITAHYTQVSAQQLKNLNSKIDEFIRVAKSK
jgi:hypothetical protein